MSQHVDTVAVTVSGLDLYVQEFALTVAVNEIPSIKLRCLPVDTAKGKTDVSAPTIKGLRQKYSDLLEKSLDGTTTASVTIKVIGKGEKACNQSVTLKKWILTDVGLSTLTTTGAPVLDVVLKHPIVRLARTGEIYEIPVLANQEDTILQSISGDNMCAFMTDLDTKVSNDTIKYYNIGESSKEGSKSKDEVIKFRKAILSDLPNKYLDGIGTVFLDPVIEDLKTLRNEALARLEFPFFGSVSLWSVIINTVCPQCLTHIRPTYDQERLKWEPLQPWDLSLIHTIKDNMIEAVELPGADPDPVCGVAVIRDEMVETANFNKHHDSTMYSDGDPTDPTSSRHSFYIPQKVNPPSKRYGRIIALSPNYVITSIKHHDRANEQTPENNMFHSTSLGDNTKYVTLEDTYAKAMFEAIYRKNCTSSVTTTLAFKDSAGQMIYPGEIMKIVAEDEELYRGYLYRMVATGSTRGGCRTKFDISYVRDPNDSNLLVTEPQKNGCYY